MKSSNRLKYNEPTHYSNGVLLGNWVEEKVSRYKKSQYNHISLYEQDYKPKRSNTKETSDIRNDSRIKSEFGDNISPPRITDENPNYFDNFSTTYDLSYQYFPQWLHGTLNRKMRFKLLKFEPTEEYLNGYGNISSRNYLRQDKREEWECDVLDPRRPVHSIAKLDFIEYTPEEYKQSRWPRLSPAKVKCGTVTESLYKQLPLNHPRTLAAKVNPITWIGGDDDDYTTGKCVCAK